MRCTCNTWKGALLKIYICKGVLFEKINEESGVPIRKGKKSCDTKSDAALRGIGRKFY